MNKISGGNGIPAELFQILKDYAVKVLHLICQQIWKFPASSGHRTGKGQFSFQSQRMFKLPHNCTNFTCQQGNAQNPSSQASTVHGPRTSRCASWIQKRQRNQTGRESNWKHPLDHRKARGYQKNIYSASLTMINTLTVQITINCEKFFKRWEYKTTSSTS